MGNGAQPFEDHFSIHGASDLFRKSRLMARLADRVRGMGKEEAYRIGIGPLEYDAILGSRLSLMETWRLESIIDKLDGAESGE